jgi:hypothetical protein
MPPKSRPGPAFVAIRAAVLGIDDISRQALRHWVDEALDHRGEPKIEHPEPTEEATKTIAAAIMTLNDNERKTFRYWILRWTDFTGRVITPSERARRLEETRQRGIDDRQ